MPPAPVVPPPSTGEPVVARTVEPAGELPFTGLPILLTLALGGTILAGGLGLRRGTRARKLVAAADGPRRPPAHTTIYPPAVPSPSAVLSRPTGLPVAARRGHRATARQLPFTGWPSSLVLLLGCAILLAGLALRLLTQAGRGQRERH